MRLRHKWSAAIVLFLAFIIGSSEFVQAEQSRRGRKRSQRWGKRANDVRERMRKVQELRTEKIELEKVLHSQERIIEEQQVQLKQQQAQMQEQHETKVKNRSQMSEQLEEFSERLMALEEDLDNVLGVQDKLIDRIDRDKLNWSGEYRMVVNNFNFIDTSVDIVPHLEIDDQGQPVIDPATQSPKIFQGQFRRNEDNKYYNNWVHRLRLTMTYDITENLRFYGQLGVFKYLNEFKEQSPVLDMHANRYPRDQSLRVERAYIDWFITDWLVFSAGRIASPEGPPAELKENTTRNATWGVQMVDAEIEAVLLTVHLSRFLERSYLRIFYSPFLTHTNFSLADDVKLFQNDGIEPMHGWGTTLEFKLPYLGDNLVQVGMVHVPTFRPRNLALNVSGLDEPVKPSEPTSQDLGQYLMFNSLVEFKDIFGIGLDLFAAYTLTMLQPTNGRMVYEFPMTLAIRDPSHIDPTTNLGQVVGQYETDYRLEVGLASYEEGAGTTNYGSMFYAGARFTIPFLGDYAPRVGVEIIQGSKYHIPWSSPSDLLVNRLNTKGEVLEVYYIQQLIPDKLFARMGFIRIKRNYTGWYIGPTTPVQQTIENFYLLIDANW